jgi:hypothetical protein
MQIKAENAALCKNLRFASLLTSHSRSVARDFVERRRLYLVAQVHRQNYQPSKVSLDHTDAWKNVKSLRNLISDDQLIFVLNSDDKQFFVPNNDASEKRK